MARDVQLRSWEEPYGVIRLGTYHAESVRVGNRLIEFSVKFARHFGKEVRTSALGTHGHGGRGFTRGWLHSETSQV